MNDLIKETIEKIKKEGTKPVSKWKFFLKKFSMWGLVFVAAAFSAVALAALVFLVSQFDWDASKNFGGPLFFGFRFFPFFWLILGGLLIFGAYEAVRHTKSGYKYDWKIILAAVVGLAVGIGTFAHFADFGERADSVARKNIPVYGAMVSEMRDQWMNPEKGFLAGEIISLKKDEIIIEDFEGEEWKILLDEKTLVRPRAEISKGEGTKIMGEKIGRNEFKAEEIRPWMGNMMQRKFDSGEFRERYRHMEPRVKGEMRQNFGPGKGIMDGNAMGRRKWE